MSPLHGTWIRLSGIVQGAGRADQPAIRAPLQRFRRTQIRNKSLRKPLLGRLTECGELRHTIPAR